MTNISYILIIDGIILTFIGVLVFYLYQRYKRRVEKKVKELVACETEKTNVYDTFSGLTALSGVSSTLDYIAKNLQKLGFPKILVFIVDKKKQTLVPKIALGFDKSLNLNNLNIPIKSQGGLISQTILKDNFFVVEDQNNLQYSNLELNKVAKTGSFMTAPIAKMSDEECWEIFHCTNTSCPSYENKDTACWTTPETQCYSHLDKDYDRKIFSNSDNKIEACLDCEKFVSLGVILVAKKDFSKFSSDEKKLLKTFAFQAGAKLERAFLLAHLEDRERELTRRMYELSILKELGDRIGYSLNTQKIADIIVSSLKKLIDYSAASYMLIDPSNNKLLFKCQLEETLNRSFVDNVKKTMIAGLSALINCEFKKEQVDESITGTIFSDNLVTPVRSFFNIPLTVGEKVVGILNVSSTRPGLYKEDEMTILYKITGQASNAVTRLQEVLETEQEKLNAMVSSMADGVLMVDNEYRIYVVNPKVNKMLGLKKDAINIFDIFNAFTGQVDFRTKLEESIKMERLVVTDEVFINSYFLKILFSPVKNKNGDTIGAVTIFHDITHDKEIEKMREDFTHMMVHDLRSPLNGIRLMSELLQKREQPPNEMKKNIATIHESTSGLLELVNDLLDVAKLESGKLQVEKIVDNLPEVIYDQIDFFKTLAQDKNINLATQIAKDLPTIKFDRKEIKQLLGNLLSNGIKYTEAGGSVIAQALPLAPDSNIEEKALQAGINWFINSKTKEIISWNKKGIICAITDSGCGIAPDQISKLFNKFEQTKSAKKISAKGTGLGLVIAKGIAEAHGGVIGVESKVDKGSTFFFILPTE